jgi:hypothetical protein
MNETEYDSNRLTGEQILTLLELTLESQVADEFQRLVGLTSPELLRETRQRLESNRLGLPGAARLLGLNELLLKSWLRSSMRLPETAQQKVAGLCLVLSLTDVASESCEASDLARAAVSAALSEKSRTTDLQGGEPASIVAAVFDAVGLAAAALHFALNAKRQEP